MPWEPVELKAQGAEQDAGAAVVVDEVLLPRARAADPVVLGAAADQHAVAIVVLLRYGDALRAT